MRKSIVNLGKVLNRNEQKQINGGAFVSRCKLSCPSLNYQGQSIPCGTSFDGLDSICEECSFGGNVGYRCRVF